MKTVFGKTDILLPRYTREDERWSAWSVIACDQHTSDISYWDRVEKNAKGAPSTYSLILPEAYLGTERAAKKEEAIKDAPEEIEKVLKNYEGALVYVERTLESGQIRRGVVGAIALDAYDYEKGTTPDIRPTEGTVKERIPPRVEVRRRSVYEASHVMLFTEDRDLFDYLTAVKHTLTVLYDFDLMEGGGHITGRLVSGKALERAETLIEKYENERRSAGKMVYGVGDGNHSLASAKAYLEELRAAGKSTAPAEEALVELVPITEKSIVFEPIYKSVSNVDTKDFIAYVKSRGGDGKKVEIVHGDVSETVYIPCGDGEIICGALQNLIDSYTSEHGGKCDYIHGEDDLRALAKEGEVGFVFDGIKKEDLFPFVSEHGVLPRKAFSMGEASEKRYYTELRKLK